MKDRIEAVTLLERNVTIVVGEPVSTGMLEHSQGYEDGDANAEVETIRVDDAGRVHISFVHNEDKALRRRGWVICNEPCIATLVDGPLAEKAPPPKPVVSEESRTVRSQMNAELGRTSDGVDEIEVAVPSEVVEAVAPGIYVTDEVRHTDPQEEVIADEDVLAGVGMLD